MFFKKIIVFFILSLLLFSTISVLAFDDSVYVWSNSSESISTSVTQVAKQEGNFLVITSGSAILIDQKTRSCFI